MPTQRDGFKNEILIILPIPLIEQLASHPLTASLYISDIGKFPQAPEHLVERTKGCRQYILIYCSQGSGWFQLEGEKKQQVNAQQYFVIPIEQGHCYGSDKTVGWTISWIHFSGTKAECYFDYLTAGGSGKTYSGENFNEDLFQEIALDLKLSSSFANASRASLALSGIFGNMIFPNASERNNDIENSVRFMHDNLKKDLSLNEIAAKSALSVSRFSLLFKKHYQTSPIDYFIKLRMQRACQYLQTSPMKVREIAELLGYEDPYYFTRLFTRVIGMSPRQYRKQR